MVQKEGVLGLRGGFHLKFHLKGFPCPKRVFHLFDLIGGRYWDRTSDPSRVKGVLSR